MTPRHEVIVIEADEQPKQLDWTERQIRVAAYCRVSTEDEEQQTSYNTQMDYFRDKIMTNPHWIMAGVFADEGISATSTKKRTEFQKMLRKCKQGKIDLILTKSVSRFARNTLDCIGITRELKNLGVAVYFEKENINTMESDSEFVLTILGSLAQAESESISKNVAWGKRQAMKSGKVSNFGKVYGYRLDENKIPHIVPEEAENVRRIFDWYLAGASVTTIVERLTSEGIPTSTSKNKWTESTIRSLLRNEKFCGDVIQQKTFVADVISKRIVKNNGQLPKYLIKNHHEPIISREIFYKVQTEITRRNNKIKTAEDTARDFYKYSSKHALTGIVICNECGSPYRRAVWKKRNGEKQPVWRCLNRLDHGKRYCKESPSIQEYALQDAILKAIRDNFKPEDWLVYDNTPQKLVKRQWSYEDSQEIKALKKQLIDLLSQFNGEEDFDSLALTAEKEICKLQQVESKMEQELQQMQTEADVVLEWNEVVIHSLVSRVIIQDENRAMLKFKNGKQTALMISS